jgi:hypothetical protein
MISADLSKNIVECASVVHEGVVVHTSSRLFVHQLLTKHEYLFDYRLRTYVASKSVPTSSVTGSDPFSKAGGLAVED